jgi:hypothetical protein
MTAVGDTNPAALLAESNGRPRSGAARMKDLIRPSRSLSSTSNLPSLVSRARQTLADQLASTKPYKLDDPSQFVQVPYGSLYIDCSWGDLLYAYQVSLLTPETVDSRRTWHEQIAALFRRRHNVYANAEAAAAAATAASTKGAGVAVSSTPAPPPSLINVNATLPTAYIAPSYLLAEHNIFTGLSARTCLDLYLSSRAFPVGSHVLLTAINIPDMSVVLRAHGLIPVPIDILPSTLAPDLALFEEAAGRVIKGQRVVAVIVAHLWGRRYDMSDISKIAQKHKIDVRLHKMQLADCCRLARTMHL